MIHTITHTTNSITVLRLVLPCSCWQNTALAYGFACSFSSSFAKPSAKPRTSICWVHKEVWLTFEPYTHSIRHCYYVTKFTWLVRFCRDFCSWPESLSGHVLWRLAAAIILFYRSANCLSFWPAYQYQQVRLILVRASFLRCSIGLTP